MTRFPMVHDWGSAIAALQWTHRTLGGLPHPDDRGREIIDWTGCRIMTDSEAAKYDAMMSRIRECLGDDVYDVALSICDGDDDADDDDDDDI